MPDPTPSPENLRAIVAANLASVRLRISAAERSAGRSSGSVRLVAVTKSVTVEGAIALAREGVLDLAENRPENLVEKASAPGLAGVVWHLIGTWQRRKVRDSIARVGIVHSVHSLDLGREISRRASDAGRRLPALVQVNISGEPSKQGLTAEEAPAAIDALHALSGIRIDGLMTMAPEGADGSTLRRIFAATRALRDRLATHEHPLPELSMGMSSDFEPAILEGSTMVRIGSALFRGIPSGGTLT